MMILGKIVGRVLSEAKNPTGTWLISLIFISYIIIISCDSHKNYILLQSIDNEQNVKFDIGEITTFANTIIDTSFLLKKMKSYDYYNSDFVNVISPVPDSSIFVLRLDKEHHEVEDETYISLFCELDGNRITKLFYVETCQGVWCWEMENAQINNINDRKNNMFQLKATLKSVGFALSNIIRFPYNDEGLYDHDLVRYMKIKAQFSLKENNGILKNLGNEFNNGRVFSKPDLQDR